MLLCAVWAHLANSISFKSANTHFLDAFERDNSLHFNLYFTEFEFAKVEIGSTLK